MTALPDEPARGTGAREVPLPTLLFAAFGPALAWASHFLLVYLLNSLFCSRSSTGGDLAIYVATAAFITVAMVAGRTAFRRWSALGHDRGLRTLAGEPTDRTAILLFIGIAGSVLFSLLILVEGAVPLFVRSCSVAGA